MAFSLVPSQAKSAITFTRPNAAPRLRSTAVVRAGPPSATTLTLVFVLPLSLLAGTIFTSLKIADRLDEQYLKELAMNQAMAEEDEDDEDTASEDGVQLLPSPAEEVAAAPRVRNRPRRQA